MSSDSELFRRCRLVGFAGHRKVPDRAALKAVLRREMDDFVAGFNGEVIGVSSAAAGADLLFMEVCAEAGIKSVVILPFDRKRFQEDFDDPEEWRRACELMDAALWCEIAEGNEEPPAAYHVVARQVLEVSDRMLFVWDGAPARGLGGTAETVLEAAEWKVPSRIIDAATLEARWQGSEADTLETDPVFKDLPAAASVVELFGKLDQRAMSRAPRFRWFAAGSMSVNHLATILQAMLIALILVGKELGALIKFALALVAAVLPWLGARLRLQEAWVNDRLRAELLRSVIASHQPGSPLNPPAMDLFVNERTFLRSAALQMVGQRVSWDAARDAYLKERVDGQIGYFKSKGAVAKQRMKVFGKIFWVASIGTLLFTGAAVLMKAVEMPVSDGWSRWGMEFVPSVLPGIAAWCLAMISIFEFKRRANLYDQLVETLQSLRPKLAEAKCASAATTAIRQIERLLLNELWEWQGPRKK